jgi:hypothetical protein
MATNFTLTLDTTGPGSPSVTIEGGAAYSGDNTVDLTTISTSDGTTTGYQMKIYGDVDDSADQANYRAAEANAPWITFAGSKSGVVLSSGDGSKVVKIKIRDDVLNPSSEATDSITVDSTLPVPNITVAPDRTKISKIATRDTSTFTFQVSEDVQAWKVKVVPSSGSDHSSGTQIPTTAGSTGVSGTTLAAATPQVVAIKGTDLETADAGDGAKVIKVFAQDSNTGIWSA